MITRQEYNALKPRMTALVNEMAPKIIAIHPDAALSLAMLQALVTTVLTELEYGREAIEMIAQRVIGDLEGGR